MKTPNLLLCSVLLQLLLLPSLLCNTSHNNIKCRNHERDALLKFKNGIEYDHCGLLSSWEIKEDCCGWGGIHCSNVTDHVISLNLSGLDQNCLSGKIDPSVFELKHLISLDLSSNDLSGSIPKSIDSLTNLEHLNLSNCEFSNEIPYQLGNLSRLISLDLSNNGYLTVKSLEWLSYLRMLRDIHFSYIDLSEVTNWVQILNNLPHLSSVYMDWCYLPPVYSSLSYINSSTTLLSIHLSSNFLNDTLVFQWLFNLTRIGNQIEYLDLSYNTFRGLIPNRLGNLNSLSHLILAKTELEGHIPDSFSNLKFLRLLDLNSNYLQGSILKPLINKCNLEYLHLDYNNLMDDLSKVFQTLSIGCTNKPILEHLDLNNNQFWGSVPDIISSFSLLKELHLESNRLNGTISQGIGQLFLLEILSISNNSLEGTLNHTHFLNLSRLTQLQLSKNQALVFNIDAEWKPPFQLNTIDLRNCKLGPPFPKWLLTQTNVSYLDISCSGISDYIPTTFWTKSLSPNIMYLNASHNKIEGMIPNLSTTFNDFNDIDLSSNRFQGPIPAFLGQSRSTLYLNNNFFTNSHALLSQKIQSELGYLDLSNNSLSGDLPDNWINFKQLVSLNLENNKFSGRIPNTIGALQLLDLHLQNNSFSGPLPMSIKNCSSYLIILDVGHNLLTGNIPSWIGSAFVHLSIFNLRGNQFHGSLPSSLCQLSNVQILDLGINHLSGTIPRCFNNMSAMIIRSDNLMERLVPIVNLGDRYDDDRLTETTIFEWKREEQRLGVTMEYYVLIDLSYNMLQGKIPDEIYQLKGLVSLDLSRNKFSGMIASGIGNLTSLQMLDLSNNHLSGEIPEALTKLTFLEILDLSNNDFSGKIPTSTQLQGFNTSTYLGNPFLCGDPLPYCPGDKPPTKTLSGENQQNEQRSDSIYPGLYISAVLGFIIGFWGICGTLVVKRSWRYAFFQFFDDIKDKLYVMWVVKVARAWRRP